jgi:hypothetical protein
MTNLGTAATPLDPPQRSAVVAAMAPADRVFVGFSTTNLFVSALIRQATGAKYSHAWLCHGSTLWGGAWITQADYPTTHSWTFEKAIVGWSRLMVYEISPEFYGNVRKAMLTSRRMFEEKFDIRGLLFMGVVTFATKWTHRRLNNLLAHPDELFCSEFVEDVLKATGESPFVEWHPQESAPLQVYETCEKDLRHFRKVTAAEFTAWLRDLDVDMDKVPPALIVDSL